MPGDERIIGPVRDPFHGNPPILTVTEHFNAFAATHPWVGSKVGAMHPLPNGGFLQQFQNASAFTPSELDTVFEVHGSILDKYNLVGGPPAFLGYPRTDETATIDGAGRFNHFEHGSIFWHPSTGAFEVHGLIRDTWAGMGWETSFLGYPVSDEFDSDGGRRSDFQNGSILWTPGNGAQVQPQAFAVNVPSVTFGTGLSIGGNGFLAVYSDGTTNFRGHLHDSGFPSYDCLATFMIKDPDGRVYAASHTGRTHGSDEPGSRNLDWDDWGTNDDVRRNRAKIRSGSTGHYTVQVTSDWSPQKIAEDIAAVVGVILAIIPLIFTGGGPSKSADPNYRLPDTSEGYQPGPVAPQPGPGQPLPQPSDLDLG